MGRDNAPRERQRRHLERKLGRRATYDRVLIVSEGSRTEPNYFHEIRKAYRLHTANVQVQPGSLGTAPIQVVQYARELFTKGDVRKNIQPLAFEHVCAVFDRDDHPTYFDALTLAEQLDGRLRNDAEQAVRFRAIASVPCFELWLLLHFEDIQASLHRDEVMRRLKKHISGYEKGFDHAYAVTSDHLSVAMKRAASLVARHTAFDAPEPYTAIGDLVKLLTRMRD